ncbi:hypothetical protein [Microlunatus speluncae]|uniref:hypothetical protein n=1 Tax=Microlunatus speluncae TaxID=2594267 RepID=UPI0012665562|nr:hypothetical protein [Microlunatus speluncae]
MQFIRGRAIRGPIVRGLALATLVTGGAVGLALPARAEPAVSGPAPAVSAAARAGSDCGPVRPRHPQQLDGFRLGWLPSGLGSLVSDFEYEWEEVRFTSRVWESGPDADGAYRVDLQVIVMRSPELSDVGALRDFLVEYLERDPAGWATEPFDHPDGPGFRDADEVVWLAEPGPAVRVLAGAPVDRREAGRIACAMRQVPPGR